MFKKVMKNKKICKRILESILEIEIDHIEYVKEEESLDINYDSKSIRLDVYARDENNTVYNIEMQNSFNENIPKRSRYYQGVIDLDLLSRGEDYECLEKSIIIFVCTFDFVGKGYYKYTFVPTCKEVPEYVLEDETRRIIINTLGKKGNPSKDLKEFVSVVNNVFTGGELADILYKEVEIVKKDEKVRREYMALYMHDIDIRREGRKEGFEEGKQEGKQEGMQEGLKEGRITIVNNIMKNMNCDLAKACEIAGIAIEEYKK